MYPNLYRRLRDREPTIARSRPRIAVRLLGYVDAVFKANAFTREHTEQFTYDFIMTVLREMLDADAIAACGREGASFSAGHALRLAHEAYE